MTYFKKHAEVIGWMRGITIFTGNGTISTWLVLILGIGAIAANLATLQGRPGEWGALWPAVLRSSPEVLAIAAGVLFVSWLNSAPRKNHTWNSVTWNCVASS